MKSKKNKLIMCILLLILGFIVAAQFQNVKKTIGEDLLSVNKARQLMKELEELAEKKAEIQREISQLDAEIRKFEDTEVAENDMIRGLQNELMKYQVMAGLRTLEGPGLVITIIEPPYDPNNPFFYESPIVFFYDWILGIINALNVAGAEAITINDQRYLATTEIHPNVTNLIINGVPVTPPINIAAIGDSTELEAVLNMPFGIIEDIRLYTNLQVSIRRENNIVVPRYNRIQSFDFAKPIE